MSAGGTIYLAPGNYGNVAIRDINPSADINISSLDPANIAHFDSFVVERSSALNFSKIDVGRPLAPGEPNYLGFGGLGNAHDISFTDMRFHGSLDGNPVNDGQGLNITNSFDITVQNSTFEELYRAVTTAFSNDVTIINNTISNMSVSGLTLAQVYDIRIANNLIEGFSRIVPDGHPDAIQFMTSGTTLASHDIEIRNNVLLQNDGMPFQGIFLRDELGTLPYKDVTIANNFIHTEQYNGITISHGDGIRIENNSSLSTLGDSIVDRIWIENTTALTLKNNIADTFLVTSSVYASNLNNLDLSVPSLSVSQLNLSQGAVSTPVGHTLSTVGYQIAAFGVSTSGDQAGGGSSAQPTPAAQPTPTAQPAPPVVEQITFYGSRGSDTVSGGAGDDRIFGIAANASSAQLGRGSVDRLFGGPGSDTFVLGDTRGVFYDDGNARNGGKSDYARVMDFTPGTDKIQLAANVDYQFKLERVGGAAGLSIYVDTNNNDRLDSRDELIGHVVGLSSYSPEHFAFG